MTKYDHVVQKPLKLVYGKNLEKFGEAHQRSCCEDFPGDLIITHMYYILEKGLSMCYPGPETWY